MKAVDKMLSKSSASLKRWTKAKQIFRQSESGGQNAKQIFSQSESGGQNAKQIFSQSEAVDKS
jgi:hypothetical protein